MPAKLRIFYFFFCFFLFHTGAFSAQYVYPFYKLTNRDGLTHNTVLDIAQDSSGVLWIATKEGLNKYDSYEITNYYAETHPVISSNFFNTVYVSSDNTVYAGNDGGLIVYDSRTDHFTPLLFNGKNLPGVLRVLEDQSGNVFIGTREGLYKYYPQTGLMVNYPALKGIEVGNMIQHEEQFMLLGTSEIIIIDKDGKIVKLYNEGNFIGLENPNFNALFLSAKGEIFLGTANHGLLKFNLEEGSFTRVRFTGEEHSGVHFVRAINEDRDGNLWIGTEKGVFIYDPETNESLHIEHSLEDSDYDLNDNAVYCIFASREDMMWLGTYFGGVNYTKLHDAKKFLHISPGVESGELPGKAVNKMFLSSEGILWVATEDGGVCLMDSSTKKILQVFKQGGPGGLSSNNVHSIAEDREGNIWLGHFTRGIDVFNPATGRFTHMLPNPEYSDLVFGNSVYTIYADSQENLWVGTRRNVKVYDVEQQRFIPFRPDRINFFIYHIFESRDGKMWFCARNHGILSYDSLSDTLVHYDAGSGKGLSSQQVICGTEDSAGRIWFGTVGGGACVYIPEQDSFQVISSAQGLPNNTVYGILEEREGVMWLSTNKGLSRYDYHTGRARNYSMVDGLKQMQFNFGSYLKDTSGTMYFGSIDGLTCFNPDEIYTQTNEPYVMFTDLKLFNESIDIDDSRILQQHINATDRIELKYKQNVITLNYVAVNHLSPGTNRFMYRLDGFDNGWNDAGNKTSVTYTNLAPGEYTFLLKAVTADGVESSNVKRLQIKVLRPWWLTNLALVLYGIGIMVILLFFRRRAIEREKEKSRFELEKLEKDRIKQLNQQRLNFFTYISHEFKTPLSIILASVEELSGPEGLAKGADKHLGRLKRNASRLTFLINQLMDFRKIETRHEKLMLHKGDLVQFIQDICLVFTPVFEKKHIRFVFSANKKNAPHWFDPDKMEKIVSNLVSNAVKFTPEGGRIKCDVNILSEKDPGHAESLYISISDTGKGIRKEDMKHLFSQFHKVELGEEYKVGTGLGLSLVKSLVRFLGGEIRVKSEPGQGTEFVVHLPLIIKKAPNLKFRKEKLVPQIPADLHFLMDSEEKLIVESKPSATTGHHILIVEDTIDLARVLIEHFSSKYKVSFARDGHEAMNLIRSEMPDVVLSDVMMPGLNGVELCKMIKGSRDTSHIPVILLTAKGSHDDKLKGLGHGADAYIPKPFDFKEVDLVVKNALEMRSNLRKTLLSGREVNLSGVQVHDRDKEILEKSTAIINENIENESFNVEDLAEKLGMSKTLVYLKHKKLLDLSPKEYIQMLRFKRAIELMLGTGYSISEIAYKVGFSDPNYFSKAFKKVYHKTPTQYRDEFTGENESR